jgi:hypothetical protein
VTNRLGNFDWLAVIFYPLAVILMEAFWVSPWLNWLGIWPVYTGPRPALHLASVIILLVVSLVVTRVLLRQKLPMWSVQSAVIGLGLFTMLLVLGVEYADGYVFLSGRWFVHVGGMLGATFTRPSTIVVALLAMFYLWWRGILLGQSTSYFRDIYRSFLLGMVALIVLIILWQISASSGTFQKPGAGIGFNVIAFFFFGLMAIAICHFYLMRSTMPREEAALTSVRRWLPIMLGIIGGMVLISFGVTSLFSNEFFESVGHGAGIFFDFIGKIFNYILIPFNYLFEGIFWLLRFLLNLIRGSQVTQPGGTGNMTLPEMPAVTPTEWPLWVTEAIKWFVVALVAAAVVFILAKAISRFRTRGAREEIEEVHESIFSWRGLKEDLRELISTMGQRFKKRMAASPGYHFDENAAGRLDIREIFRHLQWEAGRSGMSRRRHETASEYTGRLKRTVPDSGEPLEKITDLYVDVRYGEMSVPEEQVDSANSLWQTLRGLLRKLREAK